MDIIGPLIICLVIFFMCSLCGYCCRRRHQGAIFSTPVIITSTTTTAPPPGGYPVTVHGTTGGGLQATTYHGNSAVPMPMPQVMVNPPYPTHGTAIPQPYGTVLGYHANPPYPMTDPARMNPPSYDQVVSSTSVTQKQAPYNPNFMGN